ncbi:MAG: hypothetical protein DI604_20180 [Delftia acidovorans]|nr:MAG: hypothetical protein DI604_20180 [Delftia acidovorans]
MNPTTFFAYARQAPFGGRLTQAQIDGMNAIMALPWDDDRHLAYALATTFRETGATMQPIKENGGKAYFTRLYDVKGSRPDLARKMGNVNPGDGIRFCGRGFVQLTWYVNYLKASKVVGVDLVKNPGLAMRDDIAAKILFNGMTEGWFTGKKLADYFNATVDDPVGARRIINGTDKAQLIAGYHKNFLDAIKAAKKDDIPADVKPAMAKPDDVPVQQSSSALTMVGGLVSGGGLTAVLGINNPYAFGIAALLIVLAAIAAFMFFTGRWTVNRKPAA